jgi:hypothetical protein
MKRKIHKLLLMLSIIIAPTLWSVAQPNPSGNSNGDGVGGDPIGGGAPIGSGVMIMLAMGAAWAGKKTYDARKQ